MTRKKANMEILKKLKKYFNENPDIRFWQGLCNLGVISYINDFSQFMLIGDKHHEESEETLDKLNSQNVQ